MNKLVPKIGAVIVAATVFLFAVCMIVKFHFGSYLVCMFLPIGYIMMAAGFQHECCEEYRVCANIGLVFSAIYAVLIFLVYFAKLTSVRLEDLNEQAIRILNYQRGGLLFNYDLLGYGMMALSTFFWSFHQEGKEFRQMAEMLNDDTRNLFLQLLDYAGDRFVHKHGCRRNRQRRDDRAFDMVCLFLSDRGIGI